jgi:serine protease Do
MPLGVYISKIIDGSGADKAGLEIGNIIVGIDGQEVTKFSVITDYLYTKKKGDKITLKVKYISGRQYKEKDVEVTLY